MDTADVQSLKPRIAVIMPACNAQAYIETAIRSVQAQTLTDWELLVIDDCSQDQTARLVQRMALQDHRIRLAANEKNMGTACSRNRGLELAQGCYVAFLDSDDRWHPTKLEKQLALAEEKNADIVYTSYAIVDGDGKKRCPDFIVRQTTGLKAMLCRNEIGCSTVLLSPSMASRYRFSEQYYHEDYALWLNMMQEGAVAAGVSDVLVDYRYHPNSRAANKLCSAKSRWRIYRDLLKLPLITSGWYLARYALNGIRKYRSR